MDHENTPATTSVTSARRCTQRRRATPLRVRHSRRHVAPRHRPRRLLSSNNNTRPLRRRSATRYAAARRSVRLRGLLLRRSGSARRTGTTKPREPREHARRRLLGLQSLRVGRRVSTAVLRRRLGGRSLASNGGRLGVVVGLATSSSGSRGSGGRGGRSRLMILTSRGSRVPCSSLLVAARAAGAGAYTGADAGAGLGVVTARRCELLLKLSSEGS